MPPAWHRGPGQLPARSSDRRQRGGAPDLNPGGTRRGGEKRRPPVGGNHGRGWGEKMAVVGEKQMASAPTTRPDSQAIRQSRRRAKTDASGICGSRSRPNRWLRHARSGRKGAALAAACPGRSETPRFRPLRPPRSTRAWYPRSWRSSAAVSRPTPPQPAPPAGRQVTTKRKLTASVSQLEQRRTVAIRDSGLHD